MATVPSRKRRPGSVAPRSRERHLRVIRGGRSDKRKTPRSVAVARPGVRLAVAAGILVASFVFGLVLLHVLLAQSAFRLQSLQQEAAHEQTRLLEMRFQVATGEAPARVTEEAARIGLVVPQEQRYLLTRPGRVDE